VSRCQIASRVPNRGPSATVTQCHQVESQIGSQLPQCQIDTVSKCQNVKFSKCQTDLFGLRQRFQTFDETQPSYPAPSASHRPVGETTSLGPTEAAKNLIFEESNRHQFTKSENEQLLRIAREITLFHPARGLAKLDDNSHLSEDASHIKQFLATASVTDLHPLGGFYADLPQNHLLFWSRVSVSRCRAGLGSKIFQVTISSPDTSRRNLVLKVPPRNTPSSDSEMSHAFQQATWRDDALGAFIPGIRICPKAWDLLGTSPELVEAAEKGERFLLEHYPKEFWGRNYLSVTRDNKEATAAEIDRLVEKGWLEGPLHYRPRLVTPLGAVVKVDKFRLVVDCTKSGLNGASADVICQLDDLHSLLRATPKGAWLSKFDMADAFFHWPVNQSDCELLGIQHPTTGQFYRYRYLPFGTSQAPAIQQKWAVEVRRILNTRGLMYCAPNSPEADYSTFNVAAAYLDDFGTWHCPTLSKEQADSQFDSLKRVLADLGIEAKEKKDIRPAKEIEYVGFLINTVTLLVSLTESRRLKLCARLDEFLELSRESGIMLRRETASIIGQLQFCSILVPEGQHKLQSLYATRDMFVDPETAQKDLQSQWNRTVEVYITAGATRSLKIWRDIMSSDVSRVINLRSSVDAPLEGGFVSETVFSSQPKTTHPVFSGTLFFDGASRGNPGPASYGVSLLDESGVELTAVSAPLGIHTNNYAEYSGLIAGLKQAIIAKITHLSIRGDSMLAVNQVEGLWKTRHPNLIPLRDEARALLTSFTSYTFEHVLRAYNKRADELANEALDNSEPIISPFVLQSSERTWLEHQLGPLQLFVKDKGYKHLNTWHEPKLHQIAETLTDVKTAFLASPRDTSSTVVLRFPIDSSPYWWKQLKGFKLLTVKLNSTSSGTDSTNSLCDTTQQITRSYVGYTVIVCRPSLTNRRSQQVLEQSGTEDNLQTPAIQDLPALSGVFKADSRLLHRMSQSSLLGMFSVEHPSHLTPDQVCQLSIQTNDCPGDEIHRSSIRTDAARDSSSLISGNSLPRNTQVQRFNKGEPRSRVPAIHSLHARTQPSMLPLSLGGYHSVSQSLRAHTGLTGQDRYWLRGWREGHARLASHPRHNSIQSGSTSTSTGDEILSASPVQIVLPGEEYSHASSNEDYVLSFDQNSERSISGNESNDEIHGYHSNVSSQYDKTALRNETTTGRFLTHLRHQDPLFRGTPTGVHLLSRHGRQEPRPFDASSRSIHTSSNAQHGHFSRPDAKRLHSRLPTRRPEPVSTRCSDRERVGVIQTESIRSHQRSQSEQSPERTLEKSDSGHFKRGSGSLRNYQPAESNGSDTNQRWMAQRGQGRHGSLGCQISSPGLLPDHPLPDSAYYPRQPRGKVRSNVLCTTINFFTMENMEGKQPRRHQLSAAYNSIYDLRFENLRGRSKTETWKGNPPPISIILKKLISAHSSQKPSAERRAQRTAQSVAFD
jgi:ribonuclease HI